ncbi:SDR family NAD(P)-dependent oxidoreductase [Corallococcus macrosporus]|uniref:SDR family NAD(P)-dependent oxidoreductase n=1 Tax=Corallococcus macrosporus TaxID=35 RepID=UPI001F5D5C6F|nr:SDR family NAD(P)-dependent oxidoreductase [Corallococcus macrosporus]
MTPKQQPLNSGFGATTTTREVLGTTRLDGTVAIVTGGCAGIGLETTRALQAAGATVIVPARTPDKARAALAGSNPSSPPTTWATSSSLPGSGPR